MSISDHSLYAWIGEDEFGSGEIGLKRGLVPAGIIPLVTMDYDLHKLERPAVRSQMETQALQYNKKIRLVRFSFAEVITETKYGS
jgi:hypothetical protein